MIRSYKTRLKLYSIARQVYSNHRDLQSSIEETKSFLCNWIRNSKKSTLKNDYLEFACISLIFIGGELPDNCKTNHIRAPGAYHHARWMA